MSEATMNGKFTADEVRAILKLAANEAARIRHDHVGTGHLLLGLICEGPGVASAVLKCAGVELKSARQLIKRLLPRSARIRNATDLRYTARAKRVLEMAIDEERALGDNYVGSGHLLLGLIREPEGTAADVLRALNVDLRRTREHTLQLLAANRKTSPERRDTPILDEFARNLNYVVNDHDANPQIGHAREIARAVQALSRRTRSNVVLVGKSWLSGSAIVEGLALRIVSGHVPEVLRNRRLFALDLSALLDNAASRRQNEVMLGQLVNELRDSRCLIFIERLFERCQQHGGQGAIEVSTMVLSAAVRGHFQCIGTATPDEYRKYIESDRVFEPHFEAVNVEAPSRHEKVAIVMALRRDIEKHHMVQLPDDAIDRAVAISDRMWKDNPFPERAIDLIEHACAEVRATASTPPAEITELERRLKGVGDEKVAAIRGQVWEEAGRLRDAERRLRQERNERLQRSQLSTQSGPLVAGVAAIERAAAHMTVGSTRREIEVSERVKQWIARWEWWKDPVISKVIANAIWAALVAGVVFVILAVRGCSDWRARGTTSDGDSVGTEGPAQGDVARAKADSGSRPPPALRGGR
jgi:ATP-dependent Clp protease ATP-binding subunit ClpC